MSRRGFLGLLGRGVAALAAAPAIAPVALAAPAAPVAAAPVLRWTTSMQAALNACRERFIDERTFGWRHPVTGETRSPVSHEDAVARWERAHPNFVKTLINTPLDSEVNNRLRFTHKRKNPAGEWIDPEDEIQPSAWGHEIQPSAGGHWRGQTDAVPLTKEEYLAQGKGEARREARRRAQHDAEAQRQPQPQQQPQSKPLRSPRKTKRVWPERQQMGRDEERFDEVPESVYIRPMRYKAVGVVEALLDDDDDDPHITRELLEYGKLDAGKDAMGRTKWNMAPDRTAYKCYWVDPEGQVIPVKAHRAWAVENVFNGQAPLAIYKEMKDLGYIRATVDGRTFVINTQGWNPKQEAGVDTFIQDRGLTLQHATSA